jgi:prolyl-tRNA editing enzyme YbaK/EbsC (Cys-tRNA(Pro) deacylase)
MEKYHLKIKKMINELQINAEHYVLSTSCHSVGHAAKALKASANQFVKNICMIDEDGRLIIAIVNGEDRASTTRVSKALNIPKPRLANEAEILEFTGYPAGGVPSFGFQARFLIDPKVADSEYIYTGGGSPYALVKMNAQELISISKGTVARVRK